MLKVTENRLVAKTLPGMPQSVKKKDGIANDLLHRRKAAQRLLIDGRHERNAIDLIRELPSESESLHFVVDGHFEPCDLIPVTRRLVSPAIISRLHITTLGFNLDNVACIANGMDQGKIGQVTLMCSHYFAKAEKTSFEYLQTEIGGRGGRVAALRTHTKLILMEISDGRFFTIEGSGNLRSCKSIEQFVFTNDRELLLFHRRWIDDYIETRGNDGKYTKRSDSNCEAGN